MSQRNQHDARNSLDDGTALPTLLITSSLSSGSYHVPGISASLSSPISDVSTLTPGSTPSPLSSHGLKIRNSSVLKGAEIVRSQILSGQTDGNFFDFSQRSCSAQRQRSDSAIRQRSDSAIRQRSGSAIRQRSDSAMRQRSGQSRSAVTGKNKESPKRIHRMDRSQLKVDDNSTRRRSSSRLRIKESVGNSSKKETVKLEHDVENIGRKDNINKRNNGYSRRSQNNMIQTSDCRQQRHTITASPCRKDTRRRHREPLIDNHSTNDSFDYTSRQTTPHRQRHFGVKLSLDIPSKDAPSLRSKRETTTAKETTSVRKLGNDKAYQHAVRAGLLWQTLVGHFVRFPSHWYDGERTPSMGCDNTHKLAARWQYVYESLIKSSFLSSLIPTTDSPGRILLHIVVQDLMTMTPNQDIAIGCFHPQARGVVMGDALRDTKKNRRFVWMAVRKRHQEGSVSLIDPILIPGDDIDVKGTESPLGSKRAVNNANIRGIFGEEPPLETVFILESDLFKLLQSAGNLPSVKSMSSAHLLLHAFILK